MHLGRTLIPLAFITAFLFAGGCGKSESVTATKPASPTPLTPDTVLRVHWVGKQALGVAASSYSLMRLWNLAEGRQMERQLIERLAAAPGRLLTNTTALNASSPLAPLIYDAINEECCLEIRQPAGQAEQYAFAIRLDADHARDWHKGLADVLLATEGGYPSRSAGGWTLKSPRSQMLFELQRAGDWVVVGTANGTNVLFQEVVGRIEREHVPFTVTTRDHWLTVEADLNWLTGRFGLSTAPSAATTAMNLPRLSLLVTGDGANTLTTGELTFAKPLALHLDPWTFPTAQVQGPFVGFSAARGIGSWLNGLDVWNNFKLGQAPNQLFTWSEARAPMQLHLAAPIQSGTEMTKALGGAFATQANAWLAEHALGSIVPWPDSTGVVWKDLPMIAPYLTAKNPDWLVGGISPNALPDANVTTAYPRPPLDELLSDIASRSNLVAYQWETTGSRAESIHVLGQLFRAILRHPQMSANTASSQWLQAARNRLGNCTTTVTLAAPNKLAFERKSATGFSALELHILADWMESPQFPRGFYSTLSPVGPALKPAGKN